MFDMFLFRVAFIIYSCDWGVSSRRPMVQCHDLSQPHSGVGIVKQDTFVIIIWGNRPKHGTQHRIIDPSAPQRQ